MSQTPKERLQELAKSVEILAPAGDFASLQAAIDAGAHAVYFGLAQLNMRAKARRSFDREDLANIVERCHQSGVQALLTLNTVMYDHDLKVVHGLLDEAKACRVDAIIAADMAVVLAARERGLEVHLSTQLSVSNYQAFKFYAQFCDRIVLARELSLKMIKKLHQHIVADDLRGPSGRLMEIEAFAHGALCVATSGRCNMSLFTDNASANRGACVQNCRKEYIITDKDTGKQLLVDNNFIMSPNDIATIEFLDDIVDAGIKVLKLEGRARSPEYVSTVTGVYRKAIEAVADGRYDKADVETWLNSLQTVYNRGLSSGYYLGKPQGWSNAAGSKATHRKVEIGKVTNYYSKLQVAEIQANARGLKVDEHYVIIGNTTGVVEGRVDSLRDANEANVNAVGNKDLFSLKVPERVRVGDRLYVMQPVPGVTPQASTSLPLVQA